MIGKTESVPPKPKRDLSGKAYGWVKQRSWVEPVVGYSRSNYQMGGNLLRRDIGDPLNPRLAAAGWNLEKPARKLLIVPKIILRILKIKDENTEISLSLQHVNRKKELLGP